MSNSPGVDKEGDVLTPVHREARKQGLWEVTIIQVAPRLAISREDTLTSQHPRLDSGNTVR